MGQDASFDIDLDLDAKILNGAGEEMAVRELREQVTLAEPNIAVMREIVKPCNATLDCMLALVSAATAGCDEFGLVVDLSDDVGGGFNPSYRLYIPKRFSAFYAAHRDRLRVIAVASTGSSLSRVASKFIVGRMTQMPLTIENTRSEAIQAVREKLSDSG